MQGTHSDCANLHLKVQSYVAMVLMTSPVAAEQRQPTPHLSPLNHPQQMSGEWRGAETEAYVQDLRPWFAARSGLSLFTTWLACPWAGGACLAQDSYSCHVTTITGDHRSIIATHSGKPTVF
jgi:hypothetical protein